MQVLSAAHYRLTAVLDPVVSEEGLPAAADLLFLPPLHARCFAAAGAFLHEDAAALVVQARQLRHACDERLRAVQGLDAAVPELNAAAHELNAVAEERLAAIHRLDEERRRLASVAEERLAVIRTRDGEVQRLSQRPGAGIWSRVRGLFGLRPAC